MTIRHQKYMHWAMLLYKTLSTFGSSMDKSQQFYRGITGNVLIPKSNASFYAPTSTTGNILVAQNFAGYDGVVLCLTSGLNNYNKWTFNKEAPKYIDCSWISDFQYEAENLFTSTFDETENLKINGNMLTISSIIDCKTGISKEVIESVGVFYNSVTKFHTNESTLFDENVNITSTDYIEKIRNMMNEYQQNEISIELSAIKSVAKSVGKLHLNKSIAKFYPMLFFIDRGCNTINWKFILRLFINVIRVFIHDFVVDHASYQMLFELLRESKVRRIEIIRGSYNIRKWQKQFRTSINWMLLSLQQYKTLQRSGLLNTEKE